MVNSVGIDFIFASICWYLHISNSLVNKFKLLNKLTLVLNFSINVKSIDKYN